jgi:hypothetical protein
MRRTLASLLLALWIASACAPLLQAQSKLPACCRADGKHRCATHLQGDGFHASASGCPYSHCTVLSSHSAVAMGVQAQAVTVVSCRQDSLRLESPDLPRRVAGNTQKRGPPLA